MSRIPKIELVGLPGAGKTTLARGLIEALRARGVLATGRDEEQRAVCELHGSQSQLERWGGYARFHLPRPGIVGSSVWLAIRTRPVMWKGFHRGYLLTRHVHNDALFRTLAPPGTMLVLDQDILQEVWGILYLRECIDEAALRALVGQLGEHLPDVVVHVAVDGATALRRIRDRVRAQGPGGDVDRMVELDADTLDRAGREARRIAVVAAEVANAQLVEVDGSWALERQLDAVLGVLGTTRNGSGNVGRFAQRGAMDHWHEEVEKGDRFRFGANWKRFSALLDDERIEESKRALSSTLRLESLQGLTFLDAGGGSGLHSLAARMLGAKVHTFDYDPDSVDCAKALRARFFPDDPDWTVEQGSVLDPEYVSRLGRFDVVYSWGVLHHTGDMWRALDLVEAAVSPGGRLFIALYNDQGRWSRVWTTVKRAYVGSPAPGKLAITAMAGAYFEGRSAFGRLLRGENPLPFEAWERKKRDRGMSVWTDLVDWVGGYPFEVSKPEEIFEFYRRRGYRLDFLKTCGGGLGCNEYVFVKDGPDAEQHLRASNEGASVRSLRS